MPLFYLTKYTESEEFGTFSSVEFFSDVENLLYKLREDFMWENKGISAYNATRRSIETNIPTDKEKTDEFINLYRDILNLEDGDKNEKIKELVSFYLVAMVDKGETYYTTIKAGIVEDGKFVAIVG